MRSPVPSAGKRLLVWDDEVGGPFQPRVKVLSSARP